jgi:hypothetical protein
MEFIYVAPISKIEEYAEQEICLKAVLITCFHSGFLLSFFDPEDGGDMFLLRNVG